LHQRGTDPPGLSPVRRNFQALRLLTTTRLEVCGNLWRAWRRLPHAAEHSSWKPPPVEAEAPPDRSFIKGKRQQPQTSRMAPAKRRFQLWRQVCRRRGVPDQGSRRPAAFYSFPAEHWDHVRTTNPIESVFATVRHRTMRTKGALSQDTAKLMVFKLIQRPLEPGED
jgi:hypothetical protein